MSLGIAEARSLFPGARGYLNSASIGLPPATAADELRTAIDVWQQGHATAPGYDTYVDEARSRFAELVSVAPESVAIGSQVSTLVGMIAAGLPAGAAVLCPDGEFTSVLFPFLVRPDIDVKLVPLDQLADHINPDTTLVAFSLVQSADGEVSDGYHLAQRARECGAMTLVDTTQASGWLPYDASHFDFTVTGTYKWLMSPRGTAFMTVNPALMDTPALLYPGWYAGEAPWDSIYGAPLRLASDARRFDQSPAWLSWVGTALALRLVSDIGVTHIHQHNVMLANTLRKNLGLPPSDSAIVALPLPATAKPDSMAELSTANRAGRLRVGFHLYNDQQDVEMLVTALGLNGA